MLRATILRRPSRHNRSPYLLDAQLEDGTEVVVHNPALGCNGYVAVGVTCHVMPSAGAGLSTHTLYLAEVGGARVCVHPTVANTVAEKIIRDGHLGFAVEGLKREVGICDCRMDYAGTVYGVNSAKQNERHGVNGRQAYFEVKSAPISLDGDAHFPVGDKKRKKGEPVSERAIKQLETLAALADAGAYCAVIYVVGRTDVNRLIVGEHDPIYRRSAAAVPAFAFAVDWLTDGTFRIDRRLEIK